MIKGLSFNFFTKHLPGLGWKLLGAEEITRIHSVKKPRLEELVKGLSEDSIKFVEIGFPIGNAS